MQEETVNPESIDWGIAGKGLVAYAIQRGRRYPRLWGELWPAGSGPESIVAELFLRYVTVVRRRDPLRPAELLIFLKMHLRNLVDQLVPEAVANQGRPALLGAQRNNVGAPIAIDGQSPAPTESRRAEQLFEQREAEEVARHRIELLRNQTRDTPGLRAIVDAILDGCGPRPKQLAEWLGVEVQLIEDQLRHLRRLEAGLPEVDQDRTRQPAAGV